MSVVPFKYISAHELNRWAEKRDAQGKLPLLIRHLVHGTVGVEKLLRITFPGDEEIHRSGEDGVTSVAESSGNAWVPDGITFWELSVRGDILGKLNEDYKKRLDNPESLDLSKVSYCAVNPRDFPGKQEWQAAKRSEGRWRDVRMYDSADLEEWLEAAVPVAVRFSQFISSLPASGLTDLTTRWTNLQASLISKLPAKALLVGRSESVEFFKRWLNSPSSVLQVSGHAPQEVLDFFMALVESLPTQARDAISSRAIIIESLEAWRQIVHSRHKLLMLCGERAEIDDQSVIEAEQKGHHVLIYGGVIGNSASNSIRLERLNRHELANVLVESGIPEDKAYPLAQNTGGSFTILKRRYSRISTIITPEWGNQNPESLCPLLLAGMWVDNNDPDKQAVCEIAKTDYKEIQKTLVHWRSRADSPVRFVNDVWEFVSPLDAWMILHKALTHDTLNAFESVARLVLAVDHPRLELPLEERWMASIKGKVLPHSENLRRGVATTLALLATRAEESDVADSIRLSDRVNRIVREVLPPNASWQRWASLGNLLPLIAEAAPEAFLAAVEVGAQGDKPKLAQLFQQEGKPVTGRAEHIGLLWAMERLAWAPEHLSRVSLALAKLAEIDPVRQWANRPQNSLRDFFLPWMPHTAANVEDRLTVVRLLLQRTPRAGWKLLLALLPRSHDSASWNSPPEWRFWAEGWKRGASHEEARQAFRSIVMMSLEQVATIPEKWIDLLDRISDFPEYMEKDLRHALEILPTQAMSLQTRLNLWAKFREVSRRARYFAKTGGYITAELTSQLEGIRDRLAPDDPIELAVPAFGLGMDEMGDASLSWEAQESLREIELLKHARAVLAARGLSGIVELARRAANPGSVSIALFRETGDKYDSIILPAMLSSGDAKTEEFASQFAVCRIRSSPREWSESQPLNQWPIDAAAVFSLGMPADRRTWNYVASIGEAVETVYWKKVRRHALHTDLPSDVIWTARKLLSVGRPFSALGWLEYKTSKDIPLSGPDILDLFETALTLPHTEPREQMDSYHLGQLLKHLQKLDGVDEIRLAGLEWKLLPALDEHFVLPETLHKLMAKSPEFFMEVLSVIYRPQHETEEDRVKRQEAVEDRAELLARTERAWNLLRVWRLIPGTKDDGTIDSTRLHDWFQDARERAAQADRLEVCDITIGELFAHAPGEADGSWPCIAVRDTIEDVDAPQLARGFATGVANKRGVYMKSPHEGGRQERELEAKYEAYAKVCQAQWPRTAAVLRSISSSYAAQAKREDAEAEAER